ncbi:MAG TPA: DUF885 domain-containing protein, partial [Acidimicrobiia bacterium]|nr:DUF885 domain-containing protein [Acidimicrobiia bacterium]
MPAEPALSEVYAIADRYVEQYAALDPCDATFAGLVGHDHEMTDYSPEACAARADLMRATLDALAGAPQDDDDDDRRAAAVMRHALGLALTEYDAGERLRDVRIIFSPVQLVRQCFDLMALDTDDEWDVARERLTRVPEALRSIQAALREGVARGVVAARRQAIACSEQAATWGGQREAEPFFRTLVARRPGDERLRQAAEVATSAYAELGAYLHDEYAPQADPRDPVGRDRYSLFSRYFNGIDLDLDETYQWGWDELHRIEDAMRSVGERILPGSSIDAVIRHLDEDDARAIEGVDEFQRWNQELIDRTISDLDGTHFDLADPLKRCEAMIAPPGGAAAMYYT